MLNKRNNDGMDIHAIRRKNLLDVIRTRCGPDKGNVAKFCREVGITEGRIAQVLSETYREGKNFGEKAARTIEEAAGLPLMSLDNTGVADATPNRVKLSVVPTKERPFDQNVAPAMIGKRAIPVISAIQAGALKEITEPYELGDGSSTLYADDDYSRWAFGLEIEGNSMTPEFKPGDLVIIEPEWEPRPGEYVAAKNGNNEATFKKYRQRGTDAEGRVIFELVPLNDDYPTLRSDITPLTIIGVMAEHRRKTRQR